MSKKAPSGAKHARCVNHVPHPYPKSGWLCFTSPDADVADRVAWADHLAAAADAHRAAFLAGPAGDGLTADRTGHVVDGAVAFDVFRSKGTDRHPWAGPLYPSRFTGRAA